jgi:hypothetical protein
MTNPVQQPSGPEQTWGAPQPPASSWSTKKALATLGVAAAIAAVGGGVIYAASGHSSSDRGPGGPGGPGMSMNGAPGRNGVGAGGLPGALHGQFVVSNGNGGYRTELTQTGTVTAVSADSITAKSTDNYSQTYTITSSTTGASSVKVGDTVSIQATQSDNTATVTAISEGSANQADGMNGGPGRRNGSGMAGGPGQAGGPNGQMGGGSGGFGRPDGQFGSGTGQPSQSSN